MVNLQVPSDEAVYTKKESVVVFNQLAVKIEMDSVSNEEYFTWLDEMTEQIGRIVPGTQIAEKENSRNSPPLNTAVYYDTEDYRILPTGALLRTSCNKITHAFCAFKNAQDEHSVRRDHRYVFSGNEKSIIQNAPTSKEAIAIVNNLLSRTDIEHPGTFLEEYYGIKGRDLVPSICLDDYRYTFFVWIDQKDALRCSIDRAYVTNLRLPEHKQQRKPFSEVELAIYPRIAPDVAQDQRVVQLIKVLSDSLCQKFGVQITGDIKYQRASKVLEIHKP